MPERRLPSPVSNSQLHTALRAAARDNLMPLSLILGCVYLLSAAFGIVLRRGGIDVTVTIELLSSAANFAIAAGLWRLQLQDRWTYPLLFLVALLSGSNALSQLYLSDSPADTTNLALVIVGTGLVSLSFAWSGAIFALAWSGWLTLVMISTHRPGEWIHYGYFLAWATAIGGIVQAGRYRLCRRLIQAESRHRILIEHLPLISYIDDVSSGRRPVYISPQVESLFGYTVEEWTTSDNFWESCIYPPDRERVVAQVRSCLSAQQPWDLEYRIVGVRGRIIWANDRSTGIVLGAAGPALTYGILVDVTARKRTEAITSGGNRVLAALAAGAPTHEILEMLVQIAEEVHPEILGAVMLVDESRRLRVAAAPNLPEFFRAAIDQMPIGPAAACSGAAVFSADCVVVDDIATDPHWAPYAAAALQAKVRACWSEPIVSAAGHVIGTLDIYYQRPNIPRPIDRPLIQAAAGLAALAVERARTESDLARHRERLEELVAERTRQLEASLEKLRHSERLASVGTLAAGIAHEINNPVGMILLSAEQLRITAGDGRRASENRLVSDIIQNAKRCGNIVRSVLRFARQEPAERWPHDVNAIVGQAVELTRAYAHRRGGDIETQLAADIPQVTLNPVEMEQVFVNLIRNGIESVEGPPAITIVTSQADNFVRIEVIDNGRGIPVEERSRIFDPFYTTRQSNGGTGLGLSLTYGIVTDHGGIIQVQSAHTGGSKMIVELPKYAELAPVVSSDGQANAAR